MEAREITATKLAKKLSQVLRSGKTTIITRFGKRHSVVIAYDEYQKLLERLDYTETKLCDLKNERDLAKPRERRPSKFIWK